MPRPENRVYAFTGAFFAELARSGLRHVCVCPGSRSTPLTVAAVREPGLRTWSHIDERSAAFFALGLAAASREPVALVCTSGTAAANFLPAVIEASYAHVPLLLLTADRPPELREWGAGQTIDQLRLYGPNVRWFAEVSAPGETAEALRYARALACRALAEATGAAPGPVHLNLPFREPLEPVARPDEVPAALESDEPAALHGRASGAWTRVAQRARAPEGEEIDDLAALAAEHPRGVVSCGPLAAGPELGAALAAFARRAGWPVLADPTSQLRCGPHVAGTPILATSDLFLRAPGFAARFAPEVVLRLGASPTSKAFRLWTRRHRPPHVIHLDPEQGWHDPDHLASRVLRVDPAALLRAAAERIAPRPDTDRTWQDAFERAEALSRDALEATLAAEPALLEPRAVRELAALLPEGALLYVSSSMPVRDVDAFLPASTRGLRVLANRGANGIDGVVSSALGASAAGEGPVVLLCGDLAFLHDAGGLLAAHRHGLPLCAVVLDNDGGGIFSFLPVAAHGEAVGFREHFTTPHGLDLGPLARAYGARFTRAESWDGFRTALEKALCEPAVHVLAVPVDAERNVAHMAQISAAVEQALRAQGLA